MSRIGYNWSWSTSRALNEKKKNVILGWNVYVCLLCPSKTITIKYELVLMISLTLSLSLPLSLTVFSLPRYFDVCVYIHILLGELNFMCLMTWVHIIILSKSRDKPVDIHPWKNTAEVNLGGSPVAFWRINTESRIGAGWIFIFLCTLLVF